MRINKLEISDIIRNIELEKCFEAVSADGGFRIKISKYVPFCCIAIHNGSELRPEMQRKIALDEYERWYEEDPYTGDFISSMPVSIIANDSRYEYDLNRNPDSCIYTEAWGKKVWRKPLTLKDEKNSKQKHANYYSVLHGLISKLEALFGGCIVYDIHSFNYKRLERETPLFNIGTERINNEKYQLYVENWCNELEQLQFENIKTSVKTNDVFMGRGYNLEFLTQNFENTLVLATEIKKIYCDELSGDVFPDIVRSLQLKLKNAIINSANFFSKDLKNWHHFSKTKLLGDAIDKNLLNVDKKLHQLLRNFEVLAMVNPLNLNSEKKKFFKKDFTNIPTFKYNPIKIDVHDLKQKLLDIPAKSIPDISIRQLYESIINSYFDKVDLIDSIGSQKFLYNSLRYFGRPSDNDLRNAAYLLSLPDIPGELKKQRQINLKSAVDAFRKSLDAYGIKANIEVSNSVVSKVMTLNSKRSVLINSKATFHNRELNALIEHEIGIHMLTTANSNLQKLKVFNLGLPVYTLTQEGLAVFSEYLSGNISLSRLKKLALRVIAVDAMCNGADFIECFNLLRSRYEVEEETCFVLTARAFRGGGFTKDFLYLRGFVKIYKFWKAHNDLKPLLIGKTSIDFYNVIEEMIERQMITPPVYISNCILEPRKANNSGIYDYILSGLIG